MRIQRTELLSSFFRDRKTGNKISFWLEIEVNNELPPKKVQYLTATKLFSLLLFLLFRAFEDLQVFWRATFSKAALTLVNNGVNLTGQLVQTSGTVLCRRGEISCALTVEVQDDEVRKRQWALVKAVAACRYLSALVIHSILQYKCRSQMR